jgi:hypothetical protein
MPSPNKSEDPEKEPSLLLRYAGMATQFFVAIGLSVWLGRKADIRLGWPSPVFVWVLPLLVICGLIILVVRDTAKRKP